MDPPLPTWPASQLGEALDVVRRRSGLPPYGTASSDPPRVLHDPVTLNRYVEATAGHHGFEIEAVATPYAEVEQALCTAAPALVRLDVAGEPRFLVVTRGGRRLQAITRDQGIHHLNPAHVRSALCTALEAPTAAEVNHILTDAGLVVSNRTQDALLRERLGSTLVEGIWLLRLPPSAPFLSQVREAGLVGRLGYLVSAHALQYVLWLLAWWAVGLAALQGRFDEGWLLAWTLLLMTLIPLRLLVTWLQGFISIHAGGLLKRRLLLGTLNLRIDEVRRQGIGQLLGRVIESNAVGALALSGGFLGFVALIELVLAAGVLGLGAGGMLHASALVGWVSIVALIGWHTYRRQAAWTQKRLTLTHRLVERMVGHRTRLAQQARGGWHTGEDQEVADYLNTSRTLDRATALLLAVGPRGWLIVGFMALMPAFVAGQQAAGLAVGIGGTLLAYRALQNLTLGLTHILGAGIAWDQIKAFFHAATHGTSPPAPLRSATVPHRTPVRGETILEAHDLKFCYTPGGPAILEGAHLRVQAQDRLLLEGTSGSGKSTLAALLTGLRQPDTGLLLLRGLDQHTLGRDAWRRRVVSAPQFHENHVFSGTLAFNLLMGRGWPPTRADVLEAEHLCRNLGLGDLLDRMPAGLMQMVGETGWQLSHGEKSRLYLARALLQGAEFLILDESFGTLDPANQARALQCTLEQAPTLMVIAHP